MKLRTLVKNFQWCHWHSLAKMQLALISKCFILESFQTQYLCFLSHRLNLIAELQPPNPVQTLSPWSSLIEHWDVSWRSGLTRSASTAIEPTGQHQVRAVRGNTTKSSWAELKPCRAKISCPPHLIDHIDPPTGRAEAWLAAPPSMVKGGWFY